MIGLICNKDSKVFGLRVCCPFQLCVKVGGGTSPKVCGSPIGFYIEMVKQKSHIHKLCISIVAIFCALFFSLGFLLVFLVHLLARFHPPFNSFEFRLFVVHYDYLYFVWILVVQV